MTSASGGDPRPEEPAGFGQIRHLARQSSLLLSSGLVGYAGSFALSVVLARSLGTAAFGVWVVAWGLAQTVAVLGLVGADWILFRQGSFYESVGDTPRLRRTIHFALTMSGSALTVLGLALILLAPLLGRSVFHEPSIVPLLRIAGVLGPVIGIGQTLLYATQAFATVRDLALVRNLLQPFARLAAAAIAVAVASTAAQAMAGILVADVLLTSTAAVLLHRRIPLLGPTAPIRRRELVRFALPVWGSKVIETTRGQLFPILLGSLASFEGSAAFAASRRIVAAPASVIASLNQVYSPQASRLFLHGRRDELSVLFKSMGKWSFSLAFPLFCLTVAFPKQILSVFGPGFQGASASLVVLAFAMLFNFASGPVTTTLILTGRSRLAFIDYVLVLAVEVVLGVILIPRIGLIGAASARLAGTALNNLIPLAQVWWTTKLHPYRLDYWKPVTAGIGATLVAAIAIRVSGLGIGPPAAIVAAVVLGVVYLALMMLLGLTREDRAAVDALLRRGSPTSPDPDQVDLAGGIGEGPPNFDQVELTGRGVADQHAPVGTSPRTVQSELGQPRQPQAGLGSGARSRDDRVGGVPNVVPAADDEPSQDGSGFLAVPPPDQPPAAEQRPPATLEHHDPGDVRDRDGSAKAEDGPAEPVVDHGHGEAQP
jgi:O-antigen/teichoic acid export membrane protein